MGTFASGQVRVRSTGETGLLPGGSFGVPVDRGAFNEDGSVFVPNNPAREDHAWPVTSEGTLVPVLAMLGGPVGNSPAGQTYRWFPAVEGIEEVSVAETEISGGVQSTAFNALRQVNAFKNLGSAAAKDDFFRAQLGEFPAVSLAWENTTPLDGPMVAAPGPRAARRGSRGMAMRHGWILYLVTTRYDNEAIRRMEGEAVRDEVQLVLAGRRGTRSLRISEDPGISLKDSTVLQVTETSYIDVIRFETRFTMVERINEDVGAPWLTTRIVRPVPPETETQTEKRIPDVTVSMAYEDEDDED